MWRSLPPTEFCEITQNNGHYVVQGHSRNVTNFGTYGKHHATSYTGEWYSNLTSIYLARFWDMVAGLLLQFLLSHVMLLFNETILGELLNLVLQNIVSKKLETSVYRMVLSVFRYHKPLRRDSRVWQREGQTDRQTDFATTNAAPHSRDQKCGPRSMLATGYAHAKRQNRTGSFSHSILWGKKTASFYFCNSFVRTSSFMTVFGTRIHQ